MNFYYVDNIFDFFDVSIVLPFYKKLQEFKRVLPNNLHYFQRNGLEVIIVLDTPEEEKELLAYLKDFPFLNIKVIVNRKVHDWRNPAKAINVGIRSAKMKYIFVASPETEFLTDVIYQLRYMLEHHPKAFATGQVAFLDLSTNLQLQEVHKLRLLPYGSIMVEKKHLVEVNGYSESITTWGCDDDNIRARLELLGLTKLFVSQAIAIHREDDINGQASRLDKSEQISIESFKNLAYPNQLITNDNSWGTEFNEIAFSWDTRKHRYEHCVKYLKQYQTFWIKDKAVFDNRYNIIALIQVKNEILHLPDVLIHLDQYCDGIILLDDGSVDGSYEAAISEKLLLKVKKTSSELFDDLQLRNITLDIASFLDVDWLFFFDADERFDVRYADLYSITKQAKADSVCFHLVHLWDNENTYKVNLPEKQDGILLRYRMFKCIGRLQINSNRQLHFPATPFKKNRYDAPILIRHYGNIDFNARLKKYERYIKQDQEGLEQGYTYEYLIEENSTVKYVSELVI
jgi:hypothetical protein